jgi:hypothetical protein
VRDALPVRETDRQRGERTPEVIPTAQLAVTFRQQLSELSGSMALTVLFALMGTLLWGAMRFDREAPITRTLAEQGGLFFLTVAACWAVLVPGKFWTERRGDSWVRRGCMLLLGATVGLLACWADGWNPGQTWQLEGVSQSGVRLFPKDIAVEAAYVMYYALAFFVLRWWRMTSRRRPSRFSFAPLLGAGFWAAVLLLLLRPQHLLGCGMAVVALVMTAAIVQLVSPWEEPPAVPTRRARVRHA